MLNNDALAKLKDIHLPKTVSWWPPAIGWYLLIIVIVIAVLATLFFWRSYTQKNYVKKVGLKLLKKYEADYKRGGNNNLYAAKISELLKKVALNYYPREQVASLQSDNWIIFLNNTSKGLDFFKVKTQLLEAPYQSASEHDLNQLFKLAYMWIRERK